MVDRHPPNRRVRGTALLGMLAGGEPGYFDNPLRQDLFRAGHAHAGVLLLRSLVILRYVDEARISDGLKRVVRLGVPSSAIFLPAAFFFSVINPDATEPSGLIYLAYVGAATLAASLVVLGVGLIKKG